MFLKNILIWTVTVRLTLFKTRINKIYKFSVYIQTNWKVKIRFPIPKYHMYWTSYNFLTSNTPQPATYTHTTITPLQCISFLSHNIPTLPPSPPPPCIFFFFFFYNLQKLYTEFAKNYTQKLYQFKFHTYRNGSSVAHHYDLNSDVCHRTLDNAWYIPSHLDIQNHLVNMELSLQKGIHEIIKAKTNKRKQVKPITK